MGAALVEAALADSCNVGHAHAVTLTVTQGNDTAIRLYTVCGFREWGVEPMAILTPDGYRAKVHMTCALGAR